MVKASTIAIALSVLGFTLSNASFAQPYPNKTVRIVTFSVGGTNDTIARLLAQELTGRLGQPIVIENRPASVVPGDVVSKAVPDGYTLLVASGTFGILPLLQKTPYDPIKDFAPISLIGIAPNILAVNASVPVK